MLKALWRYRWFGLACAALLINLYGIFLLTGRSSGGVRVELTAPEGQDLKEMSEVTVRFSSDMVPSDQVGEWMDAGPISFSPDVDGLYAWQAPNRLTFKPGSPWPACVTISATIDSELRSAAGMRIAETPAFALRSQPLKATRVTPVPNDGPYPKLRIFFNSDLDPSTIEDFITVETPGRRKVDHHTAFGARHDMLDIYIREPGLTELLVKVKKGLTGSRGPLGVVSEQTFTIKPDAPLHVEQISAQVQSHSEAQVIAAFNRPVDVTAARRYIDVDPPVKFSVDTYQSWDRSRIRLAGEFLPGESYRIKFVPGIPSVEGRVLEQEVVRTVFIPDAPPSYKIVADGNYLSPRGAMRLPLELVNVRKLRIEIDRVFANNLVPLAARQAGSVNSYYGDSHQHLTERICTTNVVVQSPANRRVRHPIELRPLLGDRHGAFRVMLTSDNGQQSSRHLVVSDSGISVTRTPEALLVWVNSLRTVEALPDTTVTLFSLENQQLQQGTTDSKGLVRFALNATDESRPFMVTAQRGEDLTYLALDSSKVELGGSCGYRQYLDDNYEGFLFSDRGIYRPGETAHIKAVVRGAELAIPPRFPVMLRIRRPDGRTAREMTAPLSPQGTALFDTPWSDATPTGRYRFELLLPDGRALLGTHQVAVEEFVPPRIKVDLTCGGVTNRPLESRFEVSSRYLFGTPARGLLSNARVTYERTTFSAEMWPNHSFGDSRVRFQPIRRNLTPKTLDDSGKCVFVDEADANWSPGGPLRASISASVTEMSGRAVSAYASRQLHVHSHYLGVAIGSPNPKAGKPLTLHVVAATPEGTPAASVESVQLTLERLTWQTVIKQDHRGRNRYSSEERAVTAESDTIRLDGGQGQYLTSALEAGHYRITLDSSDRGAAVVRDFYATQDEAFTNPHSRESPDKVQLEFDKDSYEAGDTARLRVETPFTGKALLTLTTRQLLETRVLDIQENTCEVVIPVRNAFAPNVYCTLSIIRPVVAGKLGDHYRASGRIALKVSQPQCAISLDLHAPALIEPRSVLPVDIELQGVTAGAVPPELAVAVVDEAICMLTGFKTPDPFTYFTAPRRPANLLSDLYAALLPEQDEELLGTPSAPGGGVGSAIQQRLTPVKSRRFKPLALWKGRVLPEAGGHVRVKFDIPEFTGKVRVMVVVVDGERFASAMQEVVVRRPLVVLSSLPRFAAPGDRFKMPVHIINATGKSGQPKLETQLSGPLTKVISSSPVVPELTNGASCRTDVELEATENAGEAICRLRVEMGSSRFEEEIPLPVRPAATAVTTNGLFSVAPGEQLAIRLPWEWFKGSGHAGLWLSSSLAVNLGGGIDYLLRYPYGCLEQTTSQCIPMLYLKDLAQEVSPGTLDAGMVKRRMRFGLDRILAMQHYDGMFGLWPGGRRNVWASLYATWFLQEALSAGFDVPRERVDVAVTAVERWLSQSRGSSNDDLARLSGNRALACRILSEAGKPPYGWISRLLEQTNEISPESQAHLAAALAAANRRRDALAQLEKLSGALPSSPNQQATSTVYRDAILLSTWIDFNPESAAVPVLVERLNSAQTGGRWYTTTDNAMALMALGKYARYRRKGKQSDLHATVNYSGEEQVVSGHDQKKTVAVDMQDYNGEQITVQNRGDSPLYGRWQSRGVPTRGVAETRDSGMKIRRMLYDQDGDAVQTNRFRQGELVVVQLKVSGEELDNVAIQDLLPAGLEVENARLKTSATLPWIKKRQTLPIQHVDLRDDRVLIFTGAFSGSRTYCYLARAVTPGKFVLPPVTAECMYDENRRSVHGAGSFEVFSGSQPSGDEVTP